MHLPTIVSIHSNMCQQSTEVLVRAQAHEVTFLDKLGEQTAGTAAHTATLGNNGRILLQVSVTPPACAFRTQIHFPTVTLL